MSIPLSPITSRSSSNSNSRAAKFGVSVASSENPNAYTPTTDARMIVSAAIITTPTTDVIPRSLPPIPAVIVSTFRHHPS